MEESRPAPAAPDPVATAQAQGAMNQNTAISQQLLNQTNQNTPDGSLRYDQTGESTFTGADGKTYTIPRFTATTTLSPTGQRIFDVNNATKLNLATIGKDASSRIGGILGAPVNLSNDAIEGRLMELGTNRLSPQWARDEEALRTRLKNAGIGEGSEAWNSEFDRLGRNKNDALNELLLRGRTQSINEILTERQLPINEITALMSGSQVSNPQFAATPQTQVAGVDYAGMVQNNYSNQMRQYEADQRSNSSMMGGLFGLGGTLGAAGIRYGLPLLAASDRRVKENIERVAELANGLPVYRFNYVGDSEPQIGLMADDVELVHPEAVLVGPGGLKMVDYARAVRA